MRAGRLGYNARLPQFRAAPFRKAQPGQFMKTFDNPISRHLMILSVLMAALPSVGLAQNDRLGVALPPPSLYDDSNAARAPRADEQSVPTAGAPAAVPPPPTPSQPAQAPTATKSSDFAVDSPNRKLHTGATGQCVKLGTTAPGVAAPQCDNSAAAGTNTIPPATLESTAPAPSAAKAQPKPKAAVTPAPVEVKPLEKQAAKEERALEPVPAPAPAAEPAPMAPPRETITLAADALFSIGSAAIKPSAREGLDAFLKKAKGMEFESIRITGHTDPTGSPQQNINLSLQRAEAVKRYLVAQGIDAKKIQAEGVGGSMPIVTDKDCSKLPRAAKIVCLEPDRRVEIEVIKAMPKTAASK
jgi:outer membrane protein OmpA-like peptidoglycan-associated protein